MNTPRNVRLEDDLERLKADLQKQKEEKQMLELGLKDARKSLEKYQLIADFTHDWEMWYLPDGSIEYISPSFQTITGYTPQELISNPSLLNAIIYTEDLEDYRRYVDESINFVNIRQAHRFRILTLTKQLRWCEIKSKAVYDKKGKYLGQRASIGDITKLMHALGEIKDLSESKQLEARAKQKYKKDLEAKDRELVSFLMLISQTNEAIQYVRNRVNSLLKDCNDEQREILLGIKDHLQSTLHSSETWDRFRLHFESINPGFFDRLSKKFPSLSARDLKICGYIHLGLSTKEIATLQSITYESAEISRVRLRKKLGLSREIKLPDFLKSQ